MARKRRTPAGTIPGHPSTWKGKKFRSTNGRVVVEVTSYQRGVRNRWSLHFTFTQGPDDIGVGTESHLHPDEFQRRFVPYDPNEPVVEPFDITTHLTGKQPQARVIPLRPRKDSH